MEHTEAPRRLARVPRGLVGLLAIVAAVESFVATRDVSTTTHLVDSWTGARDAAASEGARNAAILCLGDSQVQQGIIPFCLGSPAYGLAVQGGQPATALALLRRAIAAGARPRAIVVGFFPGLLTSDLKINLRQWPEVVGPLGAAELAWSARSIDLGARTLSGSRWDRTGRGRRSARRSPRCSRAWRTRRPRPSPPTAAGGVITWGP